MQAPVAFTLLLLMGTGCRTPTRHLSITTTPPGASVRLDDAHAGVTPFEVEFVHYGARNLSLSLEGFLTREEVLSIEAPWYGRFPVDILSEVLLPIGWHDRRNFHFDLQPMTGTESAPDFDAAIERAERAATARNRVPQ